MNYQDGKKKLSFKDNVVLLLQKGLTWAILGVIVSATVPFIVMYCQDLNEEKKKGELVFFCQKQHCNNSITRVYCGFEMTNDSINLIDIPCFMRLGNLSPYPVEDFTIIVSMPYRTDFIPHKKYMIMEEKTSDNQSMISMGYKADKIGTRDYVPFPITTLRLNRNEQFIYTIQMAYSYRGMEDVKNLFVTLVGIPPIRKDGTTVEGEFIKYIRPILLSDNKSNESVLVFGENIVESPSKIQKLQSEPLQINQITELQ